jgi:two-component system, OmpR family, sensor histidine kinase KdpD
VPRGELRIYLGSAPGVGKTFAMLDEGWRRRQRGTDVVVGLVETHGRRNTVAQLRDLEIIPSVQIPHRELLLEELDVDAIIARRPALCLVDELAHTNAPGSRNEKRWQDIEELLAEGIDVISTLNVQHLESLNDVVSRITGITQQETVPDAFVRRADQIELVDMSPEALRRRLAHGNVYPAERIDTAMANYFRSGNLAALRELALLWVADRVEDSLQAYLSDHGIAETWETRERVVVAMTGAPTGDAVIRRAARLAGRVSGDLLGVRVASPDGLTRTDQTSDELARQRTLVGELGGTYHEVVGADTALTLLSFAQAEHGTQLVLGSSHRTRWQHLTHGSVINKVLRHAGSLDVHVISTGAPSSRRIPPANSPISPKRKRVAWAMTCVLIPALVALAVPWRTQLDLSSELLIALAVVVVIAVVGGVGVSIVASISSVLLVDYFLIAPYGTLSIGSRNDVVALAVFVFVATTVGYVVDRSARRQGAAVRARAEAEALARSTAVLVAEIDPLPRLVELVRSTFSQHSVSIIEGSDDEWSAVTFSGVAPAGSPDAGTVSFPLLTTTESQFVLVLDGPRLSGDDRRFLAAFTDQLSVALGARELSASAQAAEALEQIDVVRTALLQSVSHDLRTPLAAIKAYVSGLRQGDVQWSEAERQDVLAAVEEQSDRLNDVIGNLLDASRLEAGALAVTTEPVAVDDLVWRSLTSLDASRVELEVPSNIGMAQADPALAERALANLIANAIRFEPTDSKVHIQAAMVGAAVELRIVDHGPGIDRHQRHVAMNAFQRLGDAANGDGIGLGLSIASGFLSAMQATVELDDTPGGGLTATVTFPVAVINP